MSRLTAKIFSIKFKNINSKKGKYFIIFALMLFCLFSLFLLFKYLCVCMYILVLIFNA